MDKALNRYLNKHITLDDGEEFCPKCKGNGRLPRKKGGQIKGLTMFLKCNVCSGEGKMDWVEKVVGKKRSTMDETQQGPSQ